MAGYKAVLPDDVLKDLQTINNNADEIFGEMTKAGAETAMHNVISNVPKPELASHVRLSKTYKTPSDGGINTKVYFGGYLPFSGNRTTFVRKGRKGGKVYTSRKGVPAEFIAIMFEYGRSGLPFPKKPFFRKSFKQGEIEKAMLDAQKKASGGILE